jgi:hypothetical protein
MMQHQARRIGIHSLCGIRLRLSEDFLLAARELDLLHEQQTQAVILGDSDFTRFDDLLHMARERNDHVKHMLETHIKKHGCSLCDEN